MCNLILHLHARTWMHIHTGEHTCTNTFTMSKPRDCVGNPVPAALTAATHLTMTVLCHGRVVLGCCPSWQSKWQICLHRLQLLSAVVQLCCVMVGMRLAAASCQSKNCLLRYSCTNFDKDVLRSCAGLGQFVPDPVPYPFQTRTSHVPPLSHPAGNGRYTAIFSHRLLLSYPLYMGYGSPTIHTGDL